MKTFTSIQKLILSGIVALAAQYTNAQQVKSLIGNHFLLPIANEQSSIWQEKALRKGLTSKSIKAIYFEKDLLEDDEEEVGEFTDYIEEEKEVAVNYIIFSGTGSKALATQLFADIFGKDAKTIKGKRVLGEDKFVVKAVQAQPEAVSFTFPELVFSGENGTVAKGIKVIPFDIDGDGKVSDAERQAITSLAAFNQYVNRTKHTLLASRDR